MRRTVRILHTSLWLVLAGCQPLAVGVDRHAVVGGTDDFGDPAVVTLPISTKEHGDLSYVSCTGTVISPHVVVTAAHCLTKVGSSPTFEVFLGPEWNATTKVMKADLLYTVVRAVADPAYDESTSPNTHDAAVLVTARALPVTPMPLLREAPDDSWIGKPLRLVGSGYQDANDPTTIGVKKQVAGTVTNLFEQAFIASTAEGNLCYGDSGGPALAMVDGVEVLAGVHSTLQKGAPCTGSTAEMRVDQLLPFLDEQIALAEAAPDLGAPDAATASTSGGGCAVAGASHGDASWLAVVLVLAYGIFERFGQRRPRAAAARKRSGGAGNVFS